MSRSKISMRDVTKRAREVLSKHHSASRVIYPAGVIISSKYGATPAFQIRTGDHDSAKALALDLLDAIERMQKERG